MQAVAAFGYARCCVLHSSAAASPGAAVGTAGALVVGMTSTNKLKHVRCLSGDNRYNRWIEAHGFDRLFGVSKRTYTGSYSAIVLLERGIAKTVGYSTAAWPGSGSGAWFLTVFRTGRKD